MKLIKTLVVTSATLLCSLANAGNLLVDGSFEQPNSVGPGGYYVLEAAGSTAFTGWTVLGPLASDSVALFPDTFFGLHLNASNGHQWIDLTGDFGYDKGLKSDLIATTIGLTYHLSFDVGSHLAYGASTLGMSINGGPEKLFTSSTLGLQNMNWASFGLDWVADSSSASISFLGRANTSSSNDSVIGLDNVAFTASAVPEPSGGAMLLGGLLFFGVWPWKSRTQ